MLESIGAVIGGILVVLIVIALFIYGIVYAISWLSENWVGILIGLGLLIGAGCIILFVEKIGW